MDMAELIEKYPRRDRITTYRDCGICGYPIVSEVAQKKRHDLCQVLYRRIYNKHYQRKMNALARDGMEMDEEQKYRVRVLALHYARETATKDEHIQARGSEHLAIVKEEEAILEANPPQPLSVADGSEREHWSKRAKRMLDEG